jgi:SWI/SNF-related matrix-associated actin-dependent regulator of chromatin subfamily A-like protein 1
VNDAVASFGLFNASRRLYPHQREGVAFLSSRRAALLADDMGTGKSATAIRAFDEINARKILIVCYAIARDMWGREIPLWRSS